MIADSQSIQPSKPPVGSRIRRWLALRPIWPAAVFYLALTLLLYHDLLVSPSRVLSPYWSDIAWGEVSGRAWGLPLLRHGHLPLWNPYNFAGAPFFTGSQVPFLYPGEWLGMFWSASRSINQTLSLHTFLAALFVFLWARGRRIGFFGALTSGVIFMFSGPFYLLIYGGQVNDITAMTWTPLLFLAVDQIIVGQTRQGVLLGVFAFAMQIYASQPQSSYFTIIALAVYLIIRLPRTPAPWRSLGFCAVACLWAIAIGTLELIPSMKQNGESIRGSFHTSMVFAKSYSLPPENLLTSVVPTFLGNAHDIPYFGRWWFWSANIYFGVTGMTLAITGALFSKDRRKRACVVMAAALTILALGGNTPVYPYLYHYLPAFSTFRNMEKFATLLMLFVSVLAGMGVDAVMRSRRKARGSAAIAAILGVGLLVGARWIVGSASVGQGGHWANFLLAISHPAENVSAWLFNAPSIIKATSDFSAKQLNISGAAFVVLALCLLYVANRRRRIVLIVALVAAEMFYFAVTYRESFDTRTLWSPQLSADIAKNLGDDRVLLEYDPNCSQMLHSPSVGGYGSFRLRRNAEFLAYTRNYNLDDPRTLLVYPDADSPLLRLQRLRYQILSAKGPMKPIWGAFPLPHVLLLDRARVMKGRENILKTLDSKDFFPEREVILEEQPNVQPVTGDGPAGIVRVTGQDTEWVDIDADLTRPAILLVTDAYSHYWEVTQHSGNSQSDYQVLPADYMLRGIPLQAGHHTLRLQYVAPAWKISEAITTISLLAFFAYLSMPWISGRRVKITGDKNGVAVEPV